MSRCAQRCTKTQALQHLCSCNSRSPCKRPCMPSSCKRTCSDTWPYVWLQHAYTKSYMSSYGMQVHALISYGPFGFWNAIVYGLFNLDSKLYFYPSPGMSADMQHSTGVPPGMNYGHCVYIRHVACHRAKPLGSSKFWTPQFGGISILVICSRRHVGV